MITYAHLPRVLPLVCLSVLWLAASASAQRFDTLLVNNVKVRAAYGGCFGAAESSESCSVSELAVQFPLSRLFRRGERGEGYDGVKQPRRSYQSTPGLRALAASTPLPRRRRANGDDRSAELELSLSSFSDDKHRPPPNGGGGSGSAKRLVPADGHENSAAVEHGGTIVLVGNLVFPLPVHDAFLFEPFAGAGLGWIRSYDDPQPSVIIEEKSGFPALDYGLRASIQIHRSRFLLQAQYRRVVTFPQDLVYIYRNSRGDEFARLHTKVAPSAVGSLSFGLAIGLF